MMQLQLSSLGSPLADVLFADFLLGSREWLPVAIVAVLVIGAISWWSYRNTRMSSGTKWFALLLKLAGVALLASCLIEPLFSGLRPRPGANVFVVLADNSRSMTVQSGSQVRGDSLRNLLQDSKSWRTRLEQDFDVREYMFDGQLKHVDTAEQLTFDGARSGLFNALDTLQSRFAERPVAGVIVLSDGNATDELLTEEYNFPVYPIIDDDSAKLQDSSIRQMTVTQTNFEASPVTVNAVVSTAGYEGQNMTARIVNAKGKTLQEQKAQVKREEQEFRFRFRPEESGLSFHRMEVFPTNAKADFEKNENGDELTLDNNKRWMTVDRGGGPFRILYVSGRPDWDFKFLRRAVDEDDEIKIVGLIRVAKKQPKFTFQDRSGVGDRNTLFEGFDSKDDEDAETYDQTVFIRMGVEDEAELSDGFPKDSEELFRYHAIILDDIEAKFFSADQMLLMRRFVNQRGGGLMMMGGHAGYVEGGYAKTPLADVLPVYLRKAGNSANQEFRWKLTREGWLEDWTRLRATEKEERKRLMEIPGLKVVNFVSGLKPGASLLATVEGTNGKSSPALVTQRFGKGRSAAVLTGNMYRWQMHQDDPKQSDLQQLWRQIVRWMVADVPKRVAIKFDRPQGVAGSTKIAVTVQDEEFKPHDNAKVKVKIKTPTEEEVELSAEASTAAAGLYTVDYWPREDGPYRATALVTTSEGEDLDAKEAGWTSQPAADEFRELRTNREALQQLADRSGGELIEAKDLDRFVTSLPNRKVPVTEQWVYPLWHQWWVLGLAICCLCGEWGIRRWRGLP